MDIIEELEFHLGELGIEIPELGKETIGNFVKIKVDNTEYLYSRESCPACIATDLVREYKTEHKL